MGLAEAARVKFPLGTMCSWAFSGQQQHFRRHFSLQLEDAIGRVGRLAVGFERESHYGREFRPKCQHN
jgi:hypothetical protein